MSALKKAGQALRHDLVRGRFVDPQLFDTQDGRISARVCIEAWLDALLSELPEEAVEAGARANFDPATWADLDDHELCLELGQTAQSVQGFLSALRSSTGESQ